MHTHKKEAIKLNRINMPLDKWEKLGKDNLQKGICSNKTNIWGNLQSH